MTTFIYAENWRNTCRRTYLLCNRCCQNPRHKAEVIHHLKYSRSPFRRIGGMFLLHPPVKSVSGYEIPGWDCVPVCHSCHNNHYGKSNSRNSVHYIGVWRQPGGLGNHNVWWVAWKLRIVFWAIAITKTLC